MTVEIASTRPDHVLELAATMRSGDVAEILASGFTTVLDGLESSVRDSENAWSLLFDGRVAAIFGVMAIEQGPRLRTAVWGLTGSVVDAHRLTFMRWSKQLVEDLVRDFGQLLAFVDARYTSAIDWLECLGFSIQPPQPHPASGLPFHIVSFGGR